MTFSDGAPAAGVAIGHGPATTPTDFEGRFRIEPSPDDPWVRISRPGGQNAVPWFRRVDDGPLDFVLEPFDDPSPLTVLHVTDLHLSARESVDEYEEVPRSAQTVIGTLTSYLTEHPEISLVAATGDLTDTGTATEYRMLRTAIESLSVEVIAVPGNHDHMAGRPSFLVTERNYATNKGDPALWERFNGPRWFSLTRGGIHIVIIDWHTWELGADRELQEIWLASDLDYFAEYPWILLSHDQMPVEFLSSLRPPVVTLSGHWHTGRTVTVGATTHVNTPPLTFAGLDHAPRGATLVTIDDQQVAVTRRTDTPLASSRKPDLIRWRRNLGPQAGLPPPIDLGDQTIAAIAWDDSNGHGVVEAVDAESGNRVWRREMSPAIKANPSSGDGLLFLTDVAGGTRALDSQTGETVWEISAENPLRVWCWSEPALGQGQVVTATPARVVSRSTVDGTMTWERREPVPHANLLNHSGPVIVDRTVIIGFWPFSPSFMGLDLESGNVVWRIETPGSTQVKGASDRGTALGPWSPVGWGLPTEHGVVFPAASGWICVDARLGRLRWRVRDEGRFRPARPTWADGDHAIVVSPDRVRRIETDLGQVEWSTALVGQGIPLSPYRRTPHVGTGGALVVDGVAVVPGLDGELHILDVTDGSHIGTVTAGVRSAATPVLAGTSIIVLGLDGTLVSISLDEVVR